MCIQFWSTGSSFPCASRKSNPANLVWERACSTHIPSMQRSNWSSFQFWVWLDLLAQKQCLDLKFYKPIPSTVNVEILFVSVGNLNPTEEGLLDKTFRNYCVVYCHGCKLDHILTFIMHVTTNFNLYSINTNIVQINNGIHVIAFE